MNKLIWTKKELEEWAGEPLLLPPPLALFTAQTESVYEHSEKSVVTGTITSLVVYLPPGVRDLVWVSVLLNDHPILNAVGGDNQYHSILLADDIVKGDTVKVVVKNYDADWAHTIGTRVEIDGD